MTRMAGCDCARVWRQTNYCMQHRRQCGKGSASRSKRWWYCKVDQISSSEKCNIDAWPSRHIWSSNIQRIESGIMINKPSGPRTSVYAIVCTGRASMLLVSKGIWAATSSRLGRDSRVGCWRGRVKPLPISAWTYMEARLYLRSEYFSRTAAWCLAGFSQHSMIMETKGRSWVQV